MPTARKVWTGNEALKRLLVPIDSLAAHPRNPRRHDLPAIQDSLRTFGQQRPVLVVPPGRIDGERATIVAGHGTTAGAEAEGWTHIAVIQSDLADAEIDRYVAADNRTADLASYDDDLLAQLLKPMYDDDVLLGTGYGRDDVEQLLAELAWASRGAFATEPDAVAPEPPAEPKSQVGELYELGPHRLLCGDALVAEDVARLLDGVEPFLLCTDPPYGVELDMEWRDRAGHNELGPAEHSYLRTAGHTNTSISGDTRADWSEAFELAPSLKVAYVWHASAHTLPVWTGLERIGFDVAQTIIWDKQRFAMSRSHYHWEHEPCFYARKTGSPKWRGPRNQSTIWRAPSPKMIMAGSEEERVDHPTQKPVLLFTRPIENHLPRGGPFYEPFCGSGTGIIAAEMTGRICYAMELDPRYCDVIRQRYSDFTSQPEYAP